MNKRKNIAIRANKVNIITLGCSKNTVDSEKLLAQLKANSIEISHDEDNSDARTVIVNTCGFINDAKTQSVDTILTLIDRKAEGKLDSIYVMGCLSERYREDLQKEMPEIDGFFGVNELPEIVEIVGAKFKTELIEERYVSTPKHYAYLKISEGCDRNCSFCAIPLIRGKHISISIESLVKETEALVAKGVKEIILIAQDLSYYGLDIYKTQKISDLINAISEIEGIEWIRIHYLYPANFPMDVIQTIAQNPKVCNYIDMPIQHISSNVLKIMRRNINKEQTIELLNKMRAEIPNLVLRTTLLVGHPGETEEDFQELLEFVKYFKFDRLGVFAYSHEENTHAYTLDDLLTDEQKQERVNAIMSIQQDISFSINQSKIGLEMSVIIDSKDDEFYIGRTYGDSPDVDGEVLISTSDTNIQIGDFVNVKITDANDFDLFAAPVI